MPDSSRHRTARASAAGWIPALAFGLSFFACSAGAAPSADDIGVVRAGGQVTITASGMERAARAGAILPLPSALQTGRDGSADLRQGPTTIGVGPDTRLDFPAPAERDAYDRVVQPGGQAFYDVGPRGSRKLRVETPYLVAVIKGTQFNVVVADDSTTISLFEGSLELSAPDGGAMVHLNAGEIAIRREGEAAIRVIRMKETAATVAAKHAGTDGDGSKSPDGTVKVDTGGALPLDPALSDGDVKTEVKGDVTIATDPLPVDPVEGKIEAGVDATVETDGTLDAGIDASADIGTGTIDAGVDAGVDATADLAGGSVDTDLAAAAELDTGLVDAGVDAGAGLAADADAGTLDASLDLGADLGTADASAGLDAGVDLTGSDAGVDLGVDLLGTETDLGLDLGGSTPSDTATTPATEESGGLLGGILRGIGL